MGRCFQETFTIPYDMADVTGKAKLPDLLAHCLYVAGRQSVSLGMSDDIVFEQYGLVWIVTEHDVTIEGLPQLNETVIIETEALSYNKFFCYRRFSVYDQDEQLLMTAMTNFSLLDWKTRKVSRVVPEIVAVYQAPFDKALRRGPRYQAIDDPEVSRDYWVRFFDIDMNGHVNNSKYLEWMIDSMGYDFLCQHRPCTLNLKYTKEVSPKGTITSRMTYDNDNGISHHEIISDGHINAQARVHWQKEE